MEALVTYPLVMVLGGEVFIRILFTLHLLLTRAAAQHFPSARLLIVFPNYISPHRPTGHCVQQQRQQRPALPVGGHCPSQGPGLQRHLGTHRALLQVGAGGLNLHTVQPTPACLLAIPPTSFPVAE